MFEPVYVNDRLMECARAFKLSDSVYLQWNVAGWYVSDTDTLDFFTGDGWGSDLHVKYFSTPQEAYQAWMAYASPEVVCVVEDDISERFARQGNKLTRLESMLEFCISRFQEIDNPLKAIVRSMEREGLAVDGRFAVALSESASHLKSIARKALHTMRENLPAELFHEESE